MAKQIETPYTAWEFTDEEYPMAVCFTDLQKKHLQTEMAAVAAERIMQAVPTSGDVEVYLRAQEYYRGKMEQLAALLRTCEDAETAMQKALQEAQENQSRS